MTYDITVTITKGRDDVIRYFDDPASIPKWQPTFQSLEVTEGEPGATGSKTRLLYTRGRGTMEMMETIEERAFPERFTAIYEGKNVWNRCVNTFTEGENGHTTWTMANEFRCRGFMKVFIAFFPGLFEKETLASMTRFKEFVETQ